MRSNVKELLLSSYRAAHMELSQFGRLHLREEEKGYPTCEEEVTPFILGRTKLYRDSWMVGPLEDALIELGYAEDVNRIKRGIRKDPRAWSQRKPEIMT